MDGMLVYADCRIRHYIHEPNNGKYMYICYFLNYYVILLYWLPIIYGVVRLFSWENNKTGNWYHPFYLLIYFDCWISKDTEKLLWCKYCNRIKRPKYYWSRFIWGRNCLLKQHKYNWNSIEEKLLFTDITISKRSNNTILYHGKLSHHWASFMIISWYSYTISYFLSFLFSSLCFLSVQVNSLPYTYFP